MEFSEDILKLLPVAVLVFDEPAGFAMPTILPANYLILIVGKAQGTMYHLLLPDLNMISPNPDSQAEVRPEKPLAHLQNGKIVLTRQSQKLFCRSLSLPNKFP